MINYLFHKLVMTVKFGIETIAILLLGINRKKYDNVQCCLLYTIKQ